MTRLLPRVARLAAVLFLFPPPALAFEVSGLANPQSFLVDDATGKYYISNVQGRPMVKDGRGFITRLDADGNVDQLKWVEGGKNGAKLNAPKGMAISGNTLWVTDIDHVRGFDKTSGIPVADIDLTPFHVKYLNDIAEGPDGKLFTSDTVGNTVFAIVFAKPSPKEPAKKDPLKRKTEPAEPAQPPAPTVEVFANGKAFDSPNGLAFAKKRNLLFVTLGKGTVGAIDMNGKLEMIAKFPARGLAGLDIDDDGTLFVSSFTRGHIYRVGTDYKPKLMEHGLMGPMNISLDKKKRLVLVPSFLKHRAFTIEY